MGITRAIACKSGNIFKIQNFAQLVMTFICRESCLRYFIEVIVLIFNFNFELYDYILI